MIELCVHVVPQCTEMDETPSRVIRAHARDGCTLASGLRWRDGTSRRPQALHVMRDVNAARIGIGSGSRRRAVHRTLRLPSAPLSPPLEALMYVCAPAARIPIQSLSPGVESAATCHSLDPHRARRGSVLAFACELK